MSDLAWALKEFSPGSLRLKAYATYQAYYEGDQPLAFATDKYRSQFWRIMKGYCDNMCQSVVDVQAERLEVIGFTSSAAQPATITYDADGNEVAEGDTPMQPNPVDPEGPDVPAKTTTITIVDDPPPSRAIPV